MHFLDKFNHLLKKGTGRTKATTLSNFTPRELEIITFYFDSDYYLKTYKDISEAGVDPLNHFITYGWKEDRNPNAHFNSSWFRERYELGKLVCPIIYYYHNWKQHELFPSEEFDIQLYLELHKDIKESETEPLAHYLHHGLSEGRNTSPPNIQLDPTKKEFSDTGLFLEDYYLNIHEDLRNSGIDALEHYIYYGEKEGRKPNPFFDPNYYRKKHLSEENVTVSPLLHFATKGWIDNLNPSKEFDVSSYKVNYLKDRDINPLYYYLTEGKAKNQQPLKANEVIASQGGVLEFDPNAKIVSDLKLRALLDYPIANLSPKSQAYTDKLNMHWVMPDFSPGAGGHMTIFRIIRFLELFGHEVTIWLYDCYQHDTEDEAYNDIVKHFQLVKAQIKFIQGNNIVEEACGDIIFATDWGSVAYVNAVPNFKRRFYFVQDHEPEFYPQGSLAITARNTYSYDLDCICASPWLKQLVSEQYGRWAEEFWLSVDFNTYYKGDRTHKNDKLKIAFYARHFTPRRAVELGFLALEALAKENLNIEIHCFGAPLPFNNAPFECIDHGVCSVDELAALYRDCDLGIVFSATNYSLIPQEMMACGLPLAELNVESTQVIFPEDTVTLLSTQPVEMASQLKELIQDESKRNLQADAAYKWVKQFTWESAAKKIESDLFERLDMLGFQQETLPVDNSIKASVIIPTWNAGDLFKDVIAKLKSQVAPWNYEIVVVDSGSSDGTVEFLKEEHPDVILKQIPNDEFQHGKTRNLAISLSQGEFALVITQDALPVDEYWIYNMVISLEHYPQAAGGFGQHYAWPDADPFTKRDLANHFKKFSNHPLCVSKDTDKTKWAQESLQWKQFLHFYSDNSSIMRKSVWEKIPYPEVKFGEDQAWAWEIIKAGYQKVYCQRAVVYHSHDFDEGDIGKRAFEEAEFFKDVFGYTVLDVEKIESTIEAINNNEREWAENNNVSSEIIEKRAKAITSKLNGYKKALL